MIPCTDVLIGKWRRMNTGASDLLVYLSEARRTLTYYVRSADIGFKMRIPFETIMATEYTHDFAPGCDRASLLLGRPPTFYREVPSRTGSASTLGRSWRPANDWTEGGQASTCTRHEIVGPSGQLSMALRSILATSAPPSSIPQSTAMSNATPSSSSSIASSFFLSSPSLSYSPSSAGTSASSSTNSPPRLSSPGPNYHAMSIDINTGSRPSTSGGFETAAPYGVHHGRSRSRSQPPMQFPFHSDTFPHSISIPLGPQSASLSSSSHGFSPDFDPFAHTMPGSLVDQHTPGSAGGQGGDELSQSYPVSFHQSDVSLLPEHLSNSRPLSSSGNKHAENGTSAPFMPSAPQRRNSAIDGLAPLTPLGSTQSPPHMMRGVPASAPGIMGRGMNVHGQSNGGNGPRFMDIYSPQNLASYIMGGSNGNTNGNGGSGSDESSGSSPNHFTPFSPTPSQVYSNHVHNGMMPHSPTFELAPVPLLSRHHSYNSESMMTKNDTNSSSMYDHIAERVAFPA